MTKKIILLVSILMIISTAVFSGCIDETGTFPDITPSETGSTQKLNKFTSASEIREFLKIQASQSSFSYSGGWETVRFTGMNEMGAMAVPVSVPASTAMVSKEMAASSEMKAGAGMISSDFSTTNIQVEGVDEADFVKNDGKYIYVISQNKLIIVDAFPAENAAILSKTLIDGQILDMFVNGDRLLVFVETSRNEISFPEYDFRPTVRYTPVTTVLVFDISDRKKPGLAGEYNINGNYFRSRMIGDYVYFIVKDSVYSYNEIINMPVIRKGGRNILSPDVYYFDNPEQNYVFHTIASVNIKSDNEINAKSFMMGYSDNLYVSGNNIYVTYRKNMPATYYQELQKERFFKVVIPLLPSDAQGRINSIHQEFPVSPDAWMRISSVLNETYGRMDEQKKWELMNTIEKALSEYDMKLAQEQERTIIQKLSIDKGRIEYESKGEVPGTLLNQFSMDESNGYFRVATTSRFWTSGRGSVQFNNVYVLDDSMKITGRLEELAPDESIYSTRFIGNRLYMVTFKRIDPLFVIDLSEPSAPKVLGELKIPGFSDYLHPYDENHIIGIGKETGDNGWGGVSVKGVKLSLFDVSDVASPKQVDTYEIGMPGTDSEALRDHRAFLFNKNKNVLVIPVREVKGEQVADRYGYRQRIWQGAYVFGLTPETGFELKGKVSHLDDYEESQYYWISPYAVRRSLYMDDVLYTISERKLMMNSLEDIAGINSIELPYSSGGYNGGDGTIELIDIRGVPVQIQ
ncbi:MAG: beta-propeller domain-containing protein [Candidatus Methanoperedens sp.]|jgi:uncharacterized secreted protein with C-terminal beta-propeller domain|nr:beta-propeller domain-containing protein [Candidatus Methanoperedens sp.]